MSVAEVTARWEADEEAILGQQGEWGGHRTPAPEQIQHLSGLQIIGGMLNGEMPIPPIFDTLNFLLVELEPGRAVFQGRPQERHYNPSNT